MWHGLLLVAAVAVSGVQSAPSPTGFAGRWRLADPATPSDVIPLELLVNEGTAPPVITVERRFAADVRATRHSLSELGGFNAAKWRDRTLIMSVALRGSAPSAPTSVLESWTVVADDRLAVDITVRPLAEARAESRVPIRATYRRVPAPASHSPGLNLLDNADAGVGPAHWSRFGDAQIEACHGNACFVVRNGGTFQQTVVLPQDVAGKYLVLIGSGASERINADGVITGLPYLYATSRDADASRILSYMQLQNLTARPAGPNEWVTMSGVFAVPDAAATLHVQLNQASARGVPNNGSAARFDDLGVYVFGSEVDARAFVAAWRGRDR